MSARRFSDEERAAYRARKREDAEAALDRLLDEEGWSTWLRLRRNLHGYSWTNQVLIAVQAWQQAHADEPLQAPCAETPVLVKSAGRWKRDGFHPARGSRALAVWTFRSRRRKNGTWTCCGHVYGDEKRCAGCGRDDHYFRLGPTFDASQVRSFETGEAPVIDVPRGESIEGDEPGGQLVDALAQWALDSGLVASLDLDAESEHGELGSFNQRSRHLRVCAEGSANGRLRVLIHELAHAKGITSRGTPLSYAECEVAVECVSYVVAASTGLDTGCEAVPYMAGWGGEEARAKVRELAALIDSTARELEDAIRAIIATQEAIDAELEAVRLPA